MARTAESDINDLIPTIIANSVMYFDSVGPTKNLVKNYDMVNGSLNIPLWDDTISVTAMTAGVPQGVAQKLTTSSATLTAVKYGVTVDLEDEAIERARSGNVDILSQAGKIMGTKLAKYANKLANSLFSGLDAGLGSGSSTPMSTTYLGQALTSLVAADAPEPYYTVLHPWHAHHLALDVKVRATYPLNAPELAKPFYVDTLLGCPIFIDNNISVGSSAAYGAVLSDVALAIGWEKKPGQIEVERIQGTGYRIHDQIRVAVVEVKGTGGYYLNMKAAV